MTVSPFSPPRPSAEELALLRADRRGVAAARGPVLPFGVGALSTICSRAAGSTARACTSGAAASASWSDDAAATLFAAGIVRFAAAPGVSALRAPSALRPYAPGLEQAGLGPERILYARKGRTTASFG